MKLSEYKRQFKGFWDEFKTSKRGLVGLAIIIFFGIVAIAAPIISPYDPMYPIWTGYYPGASKPPQLADMLCMPIWYRNLPGGQNLSENIKAVPDHEFSSEEAFENEWSAPQNVMYDPTMGTHEGSVKIPFEFTDAETEKLTTIMTKKFEYPFNNPPKSYWIHMSAFVAIEGMQTGEELEEPVPIQISIQTEKENFYRRP